jgi:cytochrome b6-f complex iron-sulfur subunit
MDRRQFLGWMSVGAIASSLPVALAACNSNSEPVAETESPTDVAESPTASPAEVTASPAPEGFMTVGTIAQLDTEGFILDDKAETPYIVIRNPDTSEIAALSPICTHKGCTVAYDAAAKEFACPCHGAKYDLAGAVTNGPAEQPLAMLDSQEDGESVFVKMG